MTLTAKRPTQHRYLPHSPESEPWGIAVTAAGHQTVGPGEPYPPRGHPADHAFSWQSGRILEACQVVFISQGRGLYESSATGLQTVQSGVAMLILPGLWHRYAPDPATGWTEQWIELRGATIDVLRQRGTLAPSHALIPIDRVLEFSSLFSAIQSRMTGDRAQACDPERGALGLQVLAMLTSITAQRTGEQSMAEFVGRAERLMADSLDSVGSMPALAKQLGVGYSHFRREFKRRTGLSPHSYLAQIRLEQARRMIAASDRPLKDIAEQLRFSSPYHFSAAFKRHFGLSPGLWKQKQLRLTERQRRLASG